MDTDGRIRLLLADDHTVFREGIRSLLERHERYVVDGEVANGREAVKEAERLRPDVVLMDISMPEMSGLEATAEIRRVSPETRIIILTMHGTDEYFFRALQAGASGYLLKEAASTDLMAAIESTMRGDIAIYPSLVTRLVDDYLRRITSGEGASDYEELTERQKEILGLIGEGLTNVEIAERLSLSIHTVQAHRGHIMDRLGLHNRAQLVKYAARMGLLTDEP